jgi:hypothetical protein
MEGDALEISPRPTGFLPHDDDLSPPDLNG